MNTPDVAEIRRELRELGDPKIAEHSQRFFKTGPGEYGEGDRFIGVRIPALRRIARQCRDMPLGDAETLLRSPIHEERLLALLILVLQYQKGAPALRKQIYDLYHRNLRFVNNWDLVDVSSHPIAGDYLRDRSKRPLHQWARSKDLWKRRIAIIATLAYIKQGAFDQTLHIAEMLLHDEEDLIHKAVGWMLREVGNRDRPTEEAFLQQHYRGMPRTMLRYAIEKFPPRRRKQYLDGTA